jgi:hypothetical protein
MVSRGECSKLFVRDVDGQTSMAYQGQLTPQVLDLAAEQEMVMEQPDLDDVLEGEA